MTKSKSTNVDEATANAKKAAQKAFKDSMAESKAKNPKAGKAKGGEPNKGKNAHAPVPEVTKALKGFHAFAKCAMPKIAWWASEDLLKVTKALGPLIASPAVQFNVHDAELAHKPASQSSPTYKVWYGNARCIGEFTAAPPADTIGYIEHFKCCTAQNSALGQDDERDPSPVWVTATFSRDLKAKTTGFSWDARGDEDDGRILDLTAINGMQICPAQPYRMTTSVGTKVVDIWLAPGPVWVAWDVRNLLQHHDKLAMRRLASCISTGMVRSFKDTSPQALPTTADFAVFLSWYSATRTLVNLPQEATVRDPQTAATKGSPAGGDKSAAAE